MLRQHRNKGQEIVVEHRLKRQDPEFHIRIRVCDIDPHTGRAEIGVTATQDWEIRRAETTREFHDGQPL